MLKEYGEPSSVDAQVRDAVAIAEAIARKVQRVIREHLELLPKAERKDAEERVIQLITKKGTSNGHGTAS